MPLDPKQILHCAQKIQSTFYTAQGRAPFDLRKQKNQSEMMIHGRSEAIIDLPEGSDATRTICSNYKQCMSLPTNGACPVSVQGRAFHPLRRLGTKGNCSIQIRLNRRCVESIRVKSQQRLSFLGLHCV